MAFSAGPAPKVGGYQKGGSDIFGTDKETGYRFDYGSQQQLRGEFEKQRLADAASGRTSVAQQQLRMGLGQAQRAMGAQAGAQGSNPLAQRAAIYGGAQMQQQANMGAAALRAQEMAAAQDAMSRTYQDFAQGHMGYDQMGQQGSIAEEQMRRDYQRHKTEQEAAARDFGMQMVGTAASAMAGAASDERGKMAPAMATGSQQDATIRALQPPQYIDYGPQVKEDGGGMDLAALASLASAASDSRAKMGAYSDRGAKMASGPSGEDEEVRRLAALLERQRLATERQLMPRITADPAALDATARGLDTYRYSYRPEVVSRGAAPPGNHAGIMAQDLERTPLGRGVVFEGPDGMKRIDTHQAQPLALGLVGRLGERQDDTDARVRELARRLDAAGADTHRRLGR